MPSTYEVGRIDGKIVDTYDTVLKDFVRNSMITASDIESKNQNDELYLTKIKSADKKKLYYTINRKK